MPPPAQRLADIHGNIHQPPDHSPDAAIHSPGRFGAIRGERGGCFGEEAQ